MPIFKQIRDEDTTTETFITTHGFFDGGVGQLAGSSLASSSLSAAQKEYYINLQVLLIQLDMDKQKLYINNLPTFF